MRWLFILCASLGFACSVNTYRVGSTGDGPGPDGANSTGDSRAADPGADDVGDAATGDNGDPSATGDSSGDPPATGDPLSAGDPIPGDPRPSPCPGALPAANDPCPSIGLLCGYGSDPRDECNVLAACTKAGWAISDPDCSPAVIDPECPATLEETPGKDCTDLTTVCIFGEFSCMCTHCPPPQPVCSGTPVWFCEQPHPDSECPASRPLSGEPCPDSGKVCEYLCGQGNSMTCIDHIWQQTNSPSCPISSRRFKKNIEYLEAEARQELAEQTLDVRLAEYDYVGLIPARKRRLGFVIEDHPDLAAVADNGANIDLYAYTSMVLATVQVQAEQIAELRRELEELRARLAAQNAALVCEPE